MQACGVQTGYVLNADDCDDTNADINPDTLWYQDSDGDGFVESGSQVGQCVSPGSGYAILNSSCAGHTKIE